MECERRIENDRRREQQPFSFYSLNGRRQALRRAGDGADQVVTDSYHPHLLFVAIWILLFCAADAHNTLLLLSQGGSELNPLMDILIREDARLFVACKLLLTGLGLMLLVGYEHLAVWKGVKVAHLLYLILAGYLILIGYQSLLMPEGLPGFVVR